MGLKMFLVLKIVLILVLVIPIFILVINQITTSLCFSCVLTVYYAVRLRSVSTAALIVPATRHSTLGDRPGFSCHWRQAVELTARRHHHCNIYVDFSAQTENIFISSIDHMTMSTRDYCFIVFIFLFWFLFFSSCVLTSCIVTWSCSAFALRPH